MQQRLMIEVERAVRPIRAPHSTRLRMRRELLAHLEDIHAEEAERGGDDEAVLRRALARFGSPAELTQELQHSVPRWERYEGRLNRWLERTPGEPPLRIALRLSIAFIVLLLTQVPMVLIIQALRGGHSSVNVAALLAVTVMLTVDVFALTWLAARSSDLVREFVGPAWRNPRLWAAAVAGGVVIGGGGMLVLAFVSRGMDVPPDAVSPWGVMAVVAVFGFVAAMQLLQGEHRRLQPWESLQLD